MPAPIALFVYNRLWHTRKTVEALQDNVLANESDLYIFSDGAKSDRDQGGVQEVRNYITRLTGFKSTKIISNVTNKGLSDSITSGVKKVLSEREEVIVMEDDLVTSPFFLHYMNQALDLYRQDDAVISIHGYMYPVAATLPETFFLRGADCWGWATWKRGWDLFEPDGSRLLAELDAKKLSYDFEYGNSYPYRTMLVDQIQGRNDSWAVRWYASAFLKNKLTLYPEKSYVHNIGHDNSGTHSGSSSQYDVALQSLPIDLKKIPIKECAEARLALTKYFKVPAYWSSRGFVAAFLKFMRKFRTR